ncbi:hypothetical protein EDB85DRAFT_2288070 [Lactarius pseudohatsudake]|nr:hypothetical protein EDB85DRAFT_2288070 [Lactarius pseudohatsudake]
MDPSRTTREQRSGMRDDNTGTGGQWDNPMSKGSQGKWELGRHFGGPSTAAARTITGPRLSGQRSPVPLLTILSIDTTSGRGEDTYGQQQLGQSGYEYGSNVGGGQTGTGLGGTDTQSDQRYETSGQYGGSERATTGQTAGYTDPARNVAGAGGGRRPDDDDEYGAAVGPGGGPTGKPSMASKAMGAAEQMTGKIMGDQGKQARGREREVKFWIELIRLCRRTLQFYTAPAPPFHLFFRLVGRTFVACFLSLITFSHVSAITLGTNTSTPTA